MDGDGPFDYPVSGTASASPSPHRVPSVRAPRARLRADSDLPFVHWDPWADSLQNFSSLFIDSKEKGDPGPIAPSPTFSHQPPRLGPPGPLPAFGGGDGSSRYSPDRVPSGPPSSLTGARTPPPLFPMSSHSSTSVSPSVDPFRHPPPHLHHPHPLHLHHHHHHSGSGGSGSGTAPFAGAASRPSHTVPRVHSFEGSVFARQGLISPGSPLVMDKRRKWSDGERIYPFFPTRTDDPRASPDTSPEPLSPGIISRHGVPPSFSPKHSPKSQKVVPFDRNFAGLLIKNAKDIGYRTKCRIWVNADHGFITITGDHCDRAEILLRNLQIHATFYRFVHFDPSTFPPGIRMRREEPYVCFVPLETADLEGVRSKVNCYLSMYPPSSTSPLVSGAVGLGKDPFELSIMRSDTVVSEESLPEAPNLHALTLDLANFVGVQLRVGFTRFRVQKDLVMKRFLLKEMRHLLEVNRQIDIYMEYGLATDQFDKVLEYLRRKNRESTSLMAPIPLIEETYLKLFLHHRTQRVQKQWHICFRLDGTDRGIEQIPSVPGEDVSRTLLQQFSLTLGDAVGYCVEVKGRTPGQLHARKVSDMPQMKFEEMVNDFGENVYLLPEMRIADSRDDTFLISGQRKKVCEQHTLAEHNMTVLSSNIAHYERVDGMFVPKSGRLELSGNADFSTDQPSVDEIIDAMRRTLRVGTDLVRAMRR